MDQRARTKVTLSNHNYDYATISNEFRPLLKNLNPFGGNLCRIENPKKAAGFFTSIGLPLPENYNPCDHYIENIALIPGEEAKSYKQMEEICYLFKKSKIYKRNAKKKERLNISN